MKYKIVFPIMMLAAIPLFAQQNDETDWLSQISRNNKELQSARQAMEGDILMAKSENNLADPEFEMEYGFQRPENGLELVVSESFEWPGMYVARKKHIGSRITAMEYVYQSKALSVLVEAKQLLIELVNINKRIALQQKIQDTEKDLLENYELGNEAGELSLIDVNKLKVELFDTENQLKQLYIQKRVAVDGLKALNGGEELENFNADLFDYTSSEVASVDDCWHAYTALSPDYKVLKQNSDVAAQAVKVSKNSWLPSFRLGYKLQKEGPEKVHGLVFGVSIPLFSNRHKVKMEKAYEASNVLSSVDAEMKEEIKIRTKFAAVVELEEMIESYSSFVEDPANFEILKKALDLGQLTLLEYLTEVKYFLDANYSLLDMKYDYQTKLLELTKYSLLDETGYFE